MSARFERMYRTYTFKIEDSQEGDIWERSFYESNPGRAFNVAAAWASAQGYRIVSGPPRERKPKSF